MVLSIKCPGSFVSEEASIDNSPMAESRRMFDHQVLEKEVRVWLTGHFDGTVNPPAVEELPPFLPWVFDLSDLKSINSSGIRIWISWFQYVSVDTRIEFENVPGFFLLQASQVDGFLPQNSLFRSLRLEYYCPQTDEYQTRIFHQIPSLKSESRFVIPEEIHVQGAQQQIFELDHAPDRVFRVLKDKVQVIPSEEVVTFPE